MTVVRGYLTSSAWLWLLSVVLVCSCREVRGLFLFSFINPHMESISVGMLFLKIASVENVLVVDTSLWEGPFTSLYPRSLLRDGNPGRSQQWQTWWMGFGGWRKPSVECAGASPTLDLVISLMCPKHGWMSGWSEVENRSLWLSTQLHHTHNRHSWNYQGNRAVVGCSWQHIGFPLIK